MPVLRSVNFAVVCRGDRLAKENEAKIARRMMGDEKRAAFKREVLEEQTRRVKNAIVSYNILEYDIVCYFPVETK